MKEVDRLVDVVKKLRAPSGCPWDQEQTLDSVKSGLIEESYEVVDAIEGKDYSALCEELGDVLLQVVFQSQICSEEKHFSLEDVAQVVTEKLIRRHPHVFSDRKVSGTEEVLRNWDAIKKKEKTERTSILEGIPKHLPALQKAWQVQKRVARVGFEWDEIEDVIRSFVKRFRSLKRRC